MPKNEVGEQRVYLAYTSTLYSASLKETRTGTQIGQDPGGRS